MHTSPSGKVYIGITCNTPKRRWNNGRGYISNEYFTSAIKKYGWENFIHEVLVTNLTKEDAENLEILLIKLYKSTDRRYGYNHAKGGETNKGYKLSEETKRKLSENHSGEKNPNYGKPRPEEVKKKISESRLGERNWMYGKVYTDEEKRKLSELLKGKPKPPRTKEHIEHLKKANSHRFKPVLCVETGNIYESLRYAERETGILRGTIRKACNGKYKKAGGYTWKFIEQE